MHHNPSFNLFILHNNPFDNQGNEINKNDIFLRFDIRKILDDGLSTLKNCSGPQIEKI